ncbi:BID domain-containing T4SS effector [Bartonella sp. AU15XJBT]|uniref:BID domain-containing T4SS effector n=1 Tax=Bartonella sp. AU15XJBT TaxID=3019087 RepID=UPI00235F1B67|nr:BID domain-containing T4SS effector [Bartonella sp. AU15XJBT]
MKKNTEHYNSSTQEELQEQHSAVNATISKQINEAAQNFFYPNSKVLKNKYRIKDKEILKERCCDDVKKEIIKLLQEPPPEKFDAAYLKYLHHRLFSRAFEWAGQTRQAPFTFEDSSVAFMPILKRKEFTEPFAIGRKVQEGLEKLDKTLAEKNNLQGLPREEFVEHAAQLMIDLHHLHPFREGNRRTKRLFVEKLAQAAGHELDFSLVSKKRKDFVRVSAMERGDPEPMQHLLEDISNPEKLLILQEFTNSMRKLGMGERNYYLAVVAKEGETYHGTYRGCGANSFMMDVQGTLILGNKKDLTPEQTQTLTIGEVFSFTAPKTQSPQKNQKKNQQKTLLPEEKRAAHTNDEITEKSKDNTSIQTKRKEKAHFAPWITPHTSHDSVEVMPQSLQEKEQIAQPMAQSASSMRQTQKDFQETIFQTQNTVTNDLTTVQITQKNLSDHQQIGTQPPKKAMAYWDSTTKKIDTAPLSSHEKLSSLSKTEEDNTMYRNFLYPNSITLKNKYGIENYGKLKVQCAHDTAKAIIHLRQEEPPQSLNSTYLQYIHHTLFKNTFEWAGKTREKPFTFEDGTVACMPKMKKADISFASKKQIQEGLKNLDKTLAETNNLKGLTRETFVEQAAEIMIQLNYTHPFREGNGRTQRIFFEKLAQVAGHTLDFSLVTEKRMNFASIASLKHNDKEEMKHLFEDISNPEKTLILKEFMDNMKNIGLENINHRLIMTAKEGETYHGTYRGCGPNGFMLDANGDFILGNKKDLTPKQIHTLKIGDALSFTAPSAQHQQEVLIPAEKIAPLTSDEIVTGIKNNTSLHARRTEIETLCQIIYGNRHILQEKIERIHKNQTEGEQLTYQIATSPQSISKLSGSNVFGIKNNARANAEANILPLCRAIERYIDIFTQTKRDILHDHHVKQKRCEQTVEMPQAWMQNLLSLSKEQQQETLSNSPKLRGEIKNYIKKINERLSSSEHEAIKENNPEKLAKSLGTSAIKAKEILAIVKQTKEIEHNIHSMDFYDRKLNERSASNQRQSIQHQLLKKNTEKTCSNTLDKETSKAHKMIENIHQHIKRQENIQPHKMQPAKAMTL